jgi:hypothetical protein
VFITWRPDNRAPYAFEERVITKAQLAQVGVDHPDLVWNAGNGWMVPEGSISDAAWPYIVADPGLIRVDRNGQTVSFDAPSEYEEAKVADLKKELASRDLPTTGSKDELRQRLEASDAAMVAAPEASSGVAADGGVQEAADTTGGSPDTSGPVTAGGGSTATSTAGSTTSTGPATAGSGSTAP